NEPDNGTSGGNKLQVRDLELFSLSEDYSSDTISRAATRNAVLDRNEGKFHACKATTEIPRPGCHAEIDHGGNCRGQGRTLLPLAGAVPRRVARREHVLRRRVQCGTHAGTYAGCLAGRSARRQLRV